MTIVRQTGRTMFGDNCAACHGFDAKGGKGFPDLTTASWLWGGDPEAIAETIRVGINSAHPKTRVAQMLAFGRDQILHARDVENVVSYVQSLSDRRPPRRRSPAKLEAGKALFAANCASCHGDDGKGKRRRRRARPDRRKLDLWRRLAVDLRPAYGAAGRDTCRHGRAG